MTTIQDIYTDLDQFKTQPTNDLADKIISNISEINKEILLEESSKLSEVLKHIDRTFFDVLAPQFIQSLEEDSANYFLKWHAVLRLFDEQGIRFLFQVTYPLTYGKDIHLLTVGLQHYYQKNFDDILLHLAEEEEIPVVKMEEESSEYKRKSWKVDKPEVVSVPKKEDLLIDYLLGHAYYFTENYKHSIQYYQNFINKTENAFISDFDKLMEMTLFEWIAFVHIGNAQTFTKFFEEAVLSFNDASELMPIEESHEAMMILQKESKRFDFKLYASNFLKVYSQDVKAFEKHNLMLEIALEKYPDSLHFRKKKVVE